MLIKTDVDLLEATLSSETIASGGMLIVKRDQVRLANGHSSQREYVVHPGAVVVVPILDNGHILLERQFRYPLKQVFIELPAGKIDRGESHLEAGKRELLEETGYTAMEWIYLGCQHPCIGYSNEIIHIYLARQLIYSQKQLDDDESLILFEYHLDECVIDIMAGKITDSKTIVALFKAQHFLKQGVEY